MVAAPFYVRLARWIARQRVRAPRCSTCPHYRVIDEHGGVCALDSQAPLMSTWPSVQAAYAVRYRGDWCERHPLYTPHLGAALTFKPGERGHESAGFNRAPTLAEAARFAIVAGTRAQSPVESKTNTGALDHGEKPSR